MSNKGGAVSSFLLPHLPFLADCDGERRRMAVEDTAQDIRAVEAILAAAWGGPVRLGPGTQLQDRVTVLRFPVLDAPPGSPATVVVKGATPHDDTPYDPDAMAPHSQAVRLF